MKITFSVVKFLGLMTHLKLVPLLYSDTCLKQEHSKKSSRRVLGNHQCEELWIAFSLPYAHVSGHHHPTVAAIHTDCFAILEPLANISSHSFYTHKQVFGKAIQPLRLYSRWECFQYKRLQLFDLKFDLFEISWLLLERQTWRAERACPIQMRELRWNPLAQAFLQRG